MHDAYEFYIHIMSILQENGNQNNQAVNSGKIQAFTILKIFLYIHPLKHDEQIFIFDNFWFFNMLLLNIINRSIFDSR